MNQQLDNIIQQLNKKWGHQTIQKGGLSARHVELLQTGFAGLDAILSGIPKGHVTELSGHPTSGLTTLTHHIVASAQKTTNNVVYIQIGQSLDIRYAQMCGIKLAQTLSVVAHNLENTLEVLREVVNSGMVGVVVVHLLSLKQPQVDLYRLLPDIRQSNCAVLLLLSSHTKSNITAVRIGIKRQRWLRDNGQIIGCLSSVSVQKNKFGRAGQNALLLMPLVQEAWS